MTDRNLSSFQKIKEVFLKILDDETSNQMPQEIIEGAKKMVNLGAGELLLTSMDRDGTKVGFDIDLTKLISDAVEVPIIASGGVGNLQHLVDGVLLGGADAVLAASIFHYGEYTIREAKEFMSNNNVEIRL